MIILDDSRMAQVCVTVDKNNDFEAKFKFGDYVRVISTFLFRHPDFFQVSYLRQDNRSPTGIKLVSQVFR